jgi:hypothetical protein
MDFYREASEARDSSGASSDVRRTAGWQIELD